MAQNGLSTKRKTIPESEAEIFFLPPYICEWAASTSLSVISGNLMSAQLLTQHCGHSEEEAENTILALKESLSWHWVENNLIP